MYFYLFCSILASMCMRLYTRYYKLRYRLESGPSSSPPHPYIPILIVHIQLSTWLLVTGTVVSPLASFFLSWLLVFFPGPRCRSRMCNVQCFHLAS
ncbi:hypothetical protein F5Y00DRAFT_249856 [Daldinia vernicosa]|uniref:uncharacterized protein n=1 Tax=Daldinia vernicosa TaxID=114800 RepID=UPI002007D4DA|nr:uncharacterized protein F5Y00DRAFT_249856 [Daldinia vernicosa]KAI0843948.1 hypothetical protein F5Y00DRAFT_249856 [Daldinia vernicosa]